MKKFIILLLFLIIATTPTSLSAMVAMQLFEEIVDNQHTKAMDNNGSIPSNMKEEIMNTYAAQAWTSSSVSKGILIGEMAIDLISLTTGEDLSQVQNIMHATNVDLISDDHAKNDPAQLIGGTFYGAIHIADYFEDKNIEKSNAAFQAELEKRIEEAPDEKKEELRKTFECQYQIDDSTGRYIDVIKRYGMEKYMECVRERQHNEYAAILKEALLKCNPWYTMEDLDELAKGDINQRNQRNIIINEALKCYYSSQDDFSENNTDQNSITAQSEQVILSNNNESITGQSEQPTSNNNNNNITTVQNEQISQANDNTKSPTNTSRISDKELLEQTTINSYKLNSYILSDENKQALDNVANILSRNTEIKINLLGHTCDIGDEDVNYNIGILRAKKVKKYLVEKGIEAYRIIVNSAGSRKPIVPNASPTDRSLNRRVEIIIIQ